jgi:hypothetical protein
MSYLSEGLSSNSECTGATVSRISIRDLEKEFVAGVQRLKRLYEVHPPELAGEQGERTQAVAQVVNSSPNLKRVQFLKRHLNTVEFRFGLTC